MINDCQISKWIVSRILYYKDKYPYDKQDFIFDQSVSLSKKIIQGYVPIFRRFQFPCCSCFRRMWTWYFSYREVDDGVEVEHVTTNFNVLYVVDRFTFMINVIVNIGSSFGIYSNFSLPSLKYIIQATHIKAIKSDSKVEIKDSSMTICKDCKISFRS